jgi:hypothetical protein
MTTAIRTINQVRINNYKSGHDSTGVKILKNPIVIIKIHGWLKWPVHF